MKQEVCEDIIKSLDEAVAILANGNVAQLKEISDHTVHNASIFQDEDSVSIAVIIFAIFKIMERCGREKSAVCSTIHLALSKARDELASGREKQYRRIINGLFSFIGKEDERLRLFIEHVIDQAQIKKGSKLYEHGISIAQAAEVLSISQYELMNYIGKTRLPEHLHDPTGIITRLEFTRRIFHVN